MGLLLSCLSWLNFSAPSLWLYNKHASLTVLILLKFHSEIKHLWSGKIPGLCLKKIFRGFGRYQYLSWILSAVHQSHTSIFNGLTLRLSPKSERRIRLSLFWKVLVLEGKTFSVLQEVIGKPVLKAVFFISLWTCADSWMAGFSYS